MYNPCLRGLCLGALKTLYNILYLAFRIPYSLGFPPISLATPSWSPLTLLNVEVLQDSFLNPPPSSICTHSLGKFTQFDGFQHHLYAMAFNDIFLAKISFLNLALYLTYLFGSLLDISEYSKLNS